ncbi:type II toxin-antitoxin system RelE/ParE family toxin [Fusibacter ferrireducens]|uniref:type II toxin-antitoxin system RelE/ParE family toxin n=1 Tax=Fusibacter ferrireducens TaxID=2785058 RepID=UPI00226B166B|nr:type II toxin-antitoxin system RelE/ParE family toxin [Fusibacter ferrireducens]
MFSIEYYTYNNRYPILDFLKSIPKKDAAKILKEIELLEEFGLSLGMPHIKKIAGTKDLWELRIKQSTYNYRVFYYAWSCYYSVKCFSKEVSKDS